MNPLTGPRASQRPGGPRHRWLLACLALVALTTTPVAAHIGSPDVFLDGHAGPYRLLVTVRPPRAIPGVAEVEILSAGTGVRQVRIVPLPLTGPGAQFAPVPDRALPSPDDPRLFTGQLWMMTAGAWQVRVAVDGEEGPGVLSVPVPTLPQSTLHMGVLLRGLLFSLMLLLCVGFISIVAALGREAGLVPGELPGPRQRRRGRIAGAFATGTVLTVVALGNWWWSAEAASYDRYVYKPLQAVTAIQPDGHLTMTVRDPGWISLRRVDDFVADHGHPMHLFVVSPALDRLWHLHPRQNGAKFEHQLPDVPGGDYEIFADVVHASGIAETLTGGFNTSGVQGAQATGDDSSWVQPQAGVSGDVALLADGSRMVRVHDQQPLRSGRLTMFTFRVEDAAGRPATDLELYMGMPGHAVFVARDRRVFAHVHPSGSAPMAAIQIGERSLIAAGGAVSSTHAGHQSAVPAAITFPYGFPQEGDYRIFVQVKRGGVVETGAFDVHVGN